MIIPFLIEGRHYQYVPYTCLDVGSPFRVDGVVLWAKMLMKNMYFF